MSLVQLVVHEFDITIYRVQFRFANALSTRTEDILDVLEFSILHGILEPTKVVGDKMSILTVRTLYDHDAASIGTLGECMGRTMVALLYCTSECNGQPWFWRVDIGLL